MLHFMGHIIQHVGHLGSILVYLYIYMVTPRLEPEMKKSAFIVLTT